MESALFAKIGEAPSAVPAIQKYTYLTREQEWHGWDTDVHTQMQCDVPVESGLLFPLRTPPEHLIPSDPNEETRAPPAPRKFDWVGTLIRFPQRAKRKAWELGLYGIPVSTGVATGMI